MSRKLSLTPSNRTVFNDEDYVVEHSSRDEDKLRIARLEALVREAEPWMLGRAAAYSLNKQMSARLKAWIKRARAELGIKAEATNEQAGL